MPRSSKQEEYVSRALEFCKSPFINLTGKYKISKNGFLIFHDKPTNPEETYLGHFGATDIIYQDRLSYSAFIHYFRYTHAVKLVADQNKLILDLGCGQGNIGRMLYQALRKPLYVGVDLDSRMLVKAITRGYGYCPVLFLQHDLYDKLPFDNETFDYIFAYEILEHLTPKHGKRFLQEIKRILKPTGLASISTPNNWKHEDPKQKAEKFRKYKKHAEITKGGMLDSHPFEWSSSELADYIVQEMDMVIQNAFGLGIGRLSDLGKEEYKVEKSRRRFQKQLLDFFPSDISRSICLLDNPCFADNMLFDIRKMV